MALLTIGFALCGALTVADEVQNHLHLLGEAQRFNFNDLRLAVRRTLLGFNGNLEGNLRNRREYYRVAKHIKNEEDALKLRTSRRGLRFRALFCFGSDCRQRADAQTAAF